MNDGQLGTYGYKVAGIALLVAKEILNTANLPMLTSQLQLLWKHTVFLFRRCLFLKLLRGTLIKSFDPRGTRQEYLIWTFGE